MGTFREKYLRVPLEAQQFLEAEEKAPEDLVTIDDFGKIKLIVARVAEAEKVEGSKKLLKPLLPGAPILKEKPSKGFEPAPC